MKASNIQSIRTFSFYIQHKFNVFLILSKFMQDIPRYIQFPPYTIAKLIYIHKGGGYDIIDEKFTLV